MFSLYRLNAIRPSQVVLVVKNLVANAGDARVAGSIPGCGRSLEKEMVTCLENSMDRRDWQATIYEVTKSQAQFLHNAIRSFLS